MKVLIDTCLRSLALRKRKKTPDEQRFVAALSELICDLQVVVVGPIRQEVLCGIQDMAQFVKVRTRLRAFPDLPIDAETYEQAGALFNACRRHGVKGSNTDFLLCAVAQRHNLAIFTTDKDFEHFGKIFKIKLHQV